MAKYFKGKRPVGKFTLIVENGRARIDCRIFEEWDDIDQSTTARCGLEGSCTVEKTIGLGEKATYTLKGMIESTIGVKDVLSLKSQVEEAVGHEVNWSTTVKSTKSFPYKAPRCGRYTLTIYQLSRIYELTYFRKKRFTWARDIWDKKWSRTLRESTNNHDAWPDVEEYDEACKCVNKKELPPHDGQLLFDFGRISFRSPYRLTDYGFDVQIVDKVLAFTITDQAAVARGLDHGFTSTFPVSLIPEPLQFLGEVSEKEIDVRIQKYLDPDAELSAELTDAAGMSMNIESVALVPVPRPEPLGT